MDKMLDKVSLEPSFITKKHHNLNVDKKGRIRLKDSVIPASLLPYIFRKLSNSKPVSSSDIQSNCYELLLGNNTYTYIENPDGSIEFRMNGKLHSKNGPARSISNGTIEYYVDGKLHRTDGPARIRDSKNTEYFLSGTKYNLLNFIELNPDSKKTKGAIGKKDFSVTKWKKYAVIKGIDNTKVLLSKTDKIPNIDNFLIEVIAKPMWGYRIESYYDPSKQFQEIYNIAVSASKWNCKKTFPSTYDIIDDNDKIFIQYERSSHKLDVVFDDNSSRSYDFSFSKDNWLEKYNSKGQLHCVDGPAVITLSNQSKYYIHGTQISKARFERKKYNEEEDYFFWTNKKNEYHTDVPIFPSKILSNGTQHYHDSGLLHNDLFPAITTEGGKNKFFIHGFELQPGEFLQYQQKQEISILADENKNYNKTNKPFEIKVENTEPKEQPSTYEGTYSKVDGPIVFPYTGPKLHIPTINSIKDNLVKSYIEDKKSNFASPTVPKKSGLKPIYNFLKEDQSKKNSTIRIQRLANKHSRKEAKMIKINIKSQEGATMSTNSNKVADTRYGQVKTGTVVGMKKGTLKLASRSVAQRLTQNLPGFSNKGSSKVIERLVQLSLLMGAAELVERVPEGVSNKVRLSSSSKYGFGGLARNLSGEIIGRDAVEIVTEIAPDLMSSLSELTTEDLNDMAAANSAELEVPKLDDIVKAATESVTAEAAVK